MTRPEFLAPPGGSLVADTRMALALIGVEIPEDDVRGWTKYELMLAYDWAMREHLSASDNTVRRRPKPSFVTAAEREGEG